MIVATSERALDEKDKRIIHLIRQGNTHKEIACMVYLSIQAINYRMAAMRKYYGCKSTTQLIDHLRLEGLV